MPHCRYSKFLLPVDKNRWHCFMYVGCWCCVAVYRQHLQRLGAVRIMGMFRRVQPYLGRSSVSRRCPGQMHPGRRSTKEKRLQLPDGRHIAIAVCRHFYHDESRVRRKNGTARKSQSTVQVGLQIA